MKYEIEKWRQARRRNFPTRENIARKEAEILKDGELGKIKESELSKLEVNLRKKLMIMDYDPIMEKKTTKAKRHLLYKVNSAKRYRTGVQRSCVDDGDKMNEDISEGNVEKPARDRSRYRKAGPRVRSNISRCGKSILKKRQEDAKNEIEESYSEDNAPIEVSAKGEINNEQKEVIDQENQKNNAISTLNRLTNQNSSESKPIEKRVKFEIEENNEVPPAPIQKNNKNLIPDPRSFSI